MSEHKLPLEKRRALGLVGLTKREPDKQARRLLNWLKRHVGWRRATLRQD